MDVAAPVEHLAWADQNAKMDSASAIMHAKSVRHHVWTIKPQSAVNLTPTVVASSARPSALGPLPVKMDLAARLHVPEYAVPMDVAAHVEPVPPEPSARLESAFAKTNAPNSAKPNATAQPSSRNV